MENYHFSEFSSMTKEDWINTSLATLGEETFTALYHPQLIPHLGVFSYYDQSDIASEPSWFTNRMSADWCYHERIRDDENMSPLELEALAQSGVQGLILTEEQLLKYSAQSMKVFKKLSFDSFKVGFEKDLPDSKKCGGFVFGGKYSEIQKEGTSFGYDLEIDVSGYGAKQDPVFEVVMVLLYLDEMLTSVSEGEALDELCSRLFVRMQLSVHFLSEVVKLRSVSLLLQSVISLVREERQPSINIPIYVAIGSGLEAMALDQQLIRLTSVFLSAVLGGASDIEVVLESNNKSISRYRDISNLLREEAMLSMVVDPLSGSYFIEKITHDMMRKSWLFFQRIKDKGGLVWLQGDYDRFIQITQS
ncbi:methylmalonyl-CoA mutase family protein [Reichenbachiella agariperforans]|uniref:methylmalonyl-CoA mutase family protein n=1 Tax=Reichenbachiella agariperforans TaxID=156994 RepID=UPI001C09826C|nr:methylmalonyl-CoA mutase family protein [Reichenbachiella agariperforans]MBU2914905.1 hypothetical protein [Reichenbachiella agariperforans]